MSRLPPNPALKELEALIGEWEVEVPESPGQRGRATFEWLEGGAYLRFHLERKQKDGYLVSTSLLLMILNSDSIRVPALVFLSLQTKDS